MVRQKNNNETNNVFEESENQKRFYKEIEKYIEGTCFASFWGEDKKNIYISAFTDEHMYESLEENKINKTDEFKNDIYIIIPKDKCNTLMAMGVAKESKFYPAIYKKMLILVPDPALIKCFEKNGARINNGTKR